MKNNTVFVYWEKLEKPRGKYRYYARWFNGTSIFYDYFSTQKELKEYFISWPAVQLSRVNRGTY